MLSCNIGNYLIKRQSERYIIMTFKQSSTDLTNDSQMHPIQELNGGLNFQSIFFATKCLLMEV